MGLGVNTRDKWGNTPLHIRPETPNTPWTLKTLAYLIKSGADVNAKNDYGETPLHVMANGCYFDYAKLLLREGADVNAKDKKIRLFFTCNCSW